MSDFLKVVSGYRFMGKIMKFSPAVRVWVFFLIAANMSSLFFLEYFEARMVLGAFLIGGLFMSVVEYRIGFVRLLGVGHTLWLFLLPWLYFRLAQLPEGELVTYWIMGLIGINSISLVIDMVDVIRYLKGERAPLA